jgi:Alkylmercury lyase
MMDERDIELRNATYRLFADGGRAPSVDEVARAAGLAAADVREGWRRLHDAHALVLDPATTELRMASPFSAVPSAYRVFAADRWWFSNCAWDAFGVFAALHADGRIDTSCPDCGDPISVEVRDERPDDESLLFHCLVPADRWWDDIVFT